MEIGSEFWLEDKNKIEYESEFIKSENWLALKVLFGVGTAIQRKFIL